MTDDSGPPPPADPSDLAPDRCPNCGGQLKFSENRPEGLCTACGIFVEVLRPSEPKPRAPAHPLPSKIRIRTATTKELLLLCHKYGLPSGGSKKDLADRLLIYVDEQGWQATVKEKETKAPESPPPEDNASRKQWATFFLNYESELGDESLETKDEKPAPAEPPAEPGPVEPVEAPSPEVAPEAKPPEATPEPAVPEPPVPEKPETTEREFPAPPVEETELPPPPEEEGVPVEIPPPPAEAEAVPEPVPEGEWEDLTPAEEIVPAEPVAEPVAAETATPAVAVPAARTAPHPAAQGVPIRSRTPTIRRSRWRRVVYYVGVFYVTIGGAGLILGSLLHDLFRVPLFGQAFAVFGRLNVGAVLIGMILLGVGGAAMAVGMRRTPVRTRATPGA